MIRVSTLFKLNPLLVLLGLLQMHRMQLTLAAELLGDRGAPQGPFSLPIATGC